jgi:nucleoid-associated protein YgaU
LPIYEPEHTSFGDERHTNVLWGRIVALGVVLLLVFLLGRATGGDGSGQQVEDLQARLASAQAEIEQLDRQVRAQATPTAPAQTGGETTGTTLPTGAASPGAGGAVTTSAPSTASATSTTVSTEDEIYIVKSGESLRLIAARFYGNASLESCIAKAQTPPITDPTTVQIGQRLTIPRPAPTAPC